MPYEHKIIDVDGALVDPKGALGRYLLSHSWRERNGEVYSESWDYGKLRLRRVLCCFSCERVEA